MKLTNLLNDSENEIFQSIKKTEDQQLVPPGYLEVRLSTKGLLGAPEVVHIRNFKVGDIVSLSLTPEKDLPQRLISVLNSMILEDVNVANWHEKEVEELMVYIFSTFYKDHLTDIDFPVRDEDLAFLKTQPNGDTRINDILNHRWVPKTEIVISRDASTYNLDDTFTSRVKISNKKSGFYVIFDFVKYGDQVIIKKWLRDYFRKEEIIFKTIESQINHNEKISKQLEDHPELANQLVNIDPEQEEKYRDYLDKRLQLTMNIVRLISIVNYNGQDVSGLSLSEKYSLMGNDARIDYGLISKLEKKQKGFKFGLKPEVQMLNPITGEPCLRRFAFRISTLLQAIQVYGDDEYDDSGIL